MKKRGCSSFLKIARQSHTPLFNTGCLLARPKKWKYGIGERINRLGEVGDRQSPIEFPVWESTPSANKDPKARPHYHNPHNHWFCNYNGSTWFCECQDETKDKGYLATENHGLQRKYDLVQFHFHTPAEHIIEGMDYYDGEMHIVHQIRDNPDHYHEELAVVGIFFREEAVGHPFFHEMGLDAEPYKKQTVEINLAKFVDEVWKQGDDVWYYKGSLTTPPYTENVNWYVLRKPVAISRGQLHFLKHMFGPCGNARPLQAAHGRAGK